MSKTERILPPAFAVIGGLLASGLGAHALAAEPKGAPLPDLLLARAGPQDQSAAALYELVLREHAAFRRKLKSARSARDGNSGPFRQFTAIRKGVQKRCILLARQRLDESASAIVQAQLDLARVLAEASPAPWYEMLFSALRTADPTAAVAEQQPAKFHAAERPPSAAEIVAPLSTLTVDGQAIDPDAFAGKWLLVDFWATWCGACVSETPRLKEVYAAFGHDRRFAMISLSIDTEPAVPRRFAEERQLEWTQGFLGQGWAAPLLADYDIDRIPAILLIDPEGRIVARDLRGAAIKAAVADALAHGNPE